MIPDFKGHQFVEDFTPGEPPSLHHCGRCGLKASLRPDGSIYFDIQRIGVFLRTSNSMRFNTSRIPPCKDWSVVRPRPASSALTATPLDPASSRLIPLKLRKANTPAMVDCPSRSETAFDAAQIEYALNLGWLAEGLICKALGYAEPIQHPVDRVARYAQ